MSKKRSILVLLVLQIIPLLFAASVAFGSLKAGCDPNSTCPAGTQPKPTECMSGNCDNVNDDGYCIICG